MSEHIPVDQAALARGESDGNATQRRRRDDVDIVAILSTRSDRSGRMARNTPERWHGSRHARLEMLHTLGHSRGHISLWRESDRSLIAGDAFITTDQESVYAVATQKPERQGPPMYFTPDWTSARSSVEQLAGLEPELVVTGHGRALQGGAMRDDLHQLAREFDQVAVPKEGKYVDNA